MNPPPVSPQKGLLSPESPAALLATPQRQKLLEQIWQRTSVSRAQFALLYRAPLERYAALVQQFPASKAHHHAYAGGMLDHGLERIACALKLRQSHLLPVGAPPETQAAQAEAWTAATAYAALLHDIGKVAVDLHIEYADGTRWFPWHGPLAQPYRFRYRKDCRYQLHGAATGLLYSRIIDPPILDWLSGFSALWESLLYVLSGHYEHAGILGELVLRADHAAIAFSGAVRLDNTARRDAEAMRSASETIPASPGPIQPGLPSTQQPANPMASAHSDSVDRVREPPTRTEGSKARHQSSAHDVASSSKRTTSHGNTATPISAAPASTPTQAASPGAQFLSWLREGIHTHRILVNKAKALVHTVAGTAYLVSPGIFQRFAQERPRMDGARENTMADWQWIQKHFEKLHVHKTAGGGRSIWTCQATTARKPYRLHGYLLVDGQTVFSELPPDNPELKLQTPDVPPEHGQLF